MNKKVMRIFLTIIFGVGFFIPGVFFNIIRNDGIFNEFYFDLGVVLGFLTAYFGLLFVACLDFYLTKMTKRQKICYEYYYPQCLRFKKDFICRNQDNCQNYFLKLEKEEENKEVNKD